MPRSIDTSVLIDAPTDAVWRIVADFERYPDWNPFIVAIEGEQRVGARLRTTLVLPGSKPRSFRPTVIAFEPVRKLAWLGHLGIKGLFDGEHTFELVPHEGGTEFRHSERFGGVLPPLMSKLLASTRDGFEAMNAALKNRAEEAGP